MMEKKKSKGWTLTKTFPNEQNNEKKERNLNKRKWSLQCNQPIFNNNNRTHVGDMYEHTRSKKCECKDTYLAVETWYFFCKEK